MGYALNLGTRIEQVTRDLQRALNAPGDAIVPAGLAIAGLEYPALEAQPYLDRIEALGRNAAYHGAIG